MTLVAQQALPSFQALREAFLADENETLARLLPFANMTDDANERVMAEARRLVESVRKRRQKEGGMQSFLQEYDLSSQEGVLLMCVAEALLRIPDAATADRLIKDKFGQGNWARHLGQSDSLLVNAGTWGMMLTGKLVTVAPDGIQDIGGWLGRLAGRAGEPVVRMALTQGMKLMAEQFVMGRSIQDALQRSHSADQAGYRHSYDMLGEAALTDDGAVHYFNAYQDAIAAIAKTVKSGQSAFEAPGISVKLSALHPRYEPAQRARVMAELLPRVQTLAEQARHGGIGLTLDAEETERLEISLEIFGTVFCSPALKGWEGFGLAVQSYQKRAFAVIDWLTVLAQRQAQMHGNQRITLRLVKGAYWDTEIKRAQMQGFSNYPVFTRKQNTDVAFLACAARMLAAPQAFYCQFATHNAHAVSAILERARNGKAPRHDFEFQRLHGMGDALYDEVIAAHAAACRVYAPVGSHEDLLPYLVRRLLENGANSSFVNRIADPNVAIDAVISDPIAAMEELSDRSNQRIPLPKCLYGAVRMNSSGFSFADTHVVEKLNAAMAPELARTDFKACAIVAGQVVRGVAVDVIDPSRGVKIGAVEQADEPTLNLALELASKWPGMPAEDRAVILDKAADLLERDRPKLMALLAREAGKTLPDALGEVREAADFCRYYAMLARKHFAVPETLPGPTGESNQLSLHGRGVFACISPWNFPLAIFMGQITAAYAAGNSVIAKPAEQTSLIADAAVRLLLEAGIPRDAIALLPGRGETIGAKLVADSRVSGVAFTGGTSTAKAISRALAVRPGALIPFIAETGGLNVMIADSSALPEQVITDVLASAFNSAGQRCSALRILCVQRDIAPRILKLLKGAMDELRIGDPSQLDTDVGPVIDAEALTALTTHRERMAREFKAVGQTLLPHDIPPGHFFAPCAFEIPGLDIVKHEVFGPILHIVQFDGDKLIDMVDAVNHSGYGLTLGIHSRIEATIQAIRARARVGNIYVNRNQIGAVVGVQPFGGEGLSGTGPKAGGPHYLFRFATERTFTVNTAAAGGNAALIASSE
jgi:RHH-type transcriptional regulator, proline utilization regulon repressor / proline dehydrogenase / delta 1-pyrroline-5-carboxylate dehydrogenase